MGGAFPTITAHTGCEGTAENTITSAVVGLDLGADIVEVDVRATADLHLVLAHHDLVPLPSGGSVSVRLSTLADLEPARRAGVLITADELLDEVLPGGRMVNLDIKDDLSQAKANALGWTSRTTVRCRSSSGTLSLAAWRRTCSSPAVRRSGPARRGGSTRT